MIRLFGMTIHSIPDKEDYLVSTTTTTTTTNSTNTKDLTQSDHGESTGRDEVVEQAKEEPSTASADEEFSVPERGGPTLSEISEEPETSSANKEGLLYTNDKESVNETCNSDEQTLERPDKLLPCPRCSSMDTKFCYYNNYNVSQPRHFCKKCQRYWTAGGTMRSVPVGSGRRKNKCSPASRYRQIIVTEALQAAAQVCATNGIYQPNGSLLAFASDSAQCKNVSSAVIHITKPGNHVRNKCFEETHDDNSSESSSTVLNPPTQQPAFCPPGFPSPFYPAPSYWGCPAQNPWNMPGLSPHCSSVKLSARSPGSNSQILGKHFREGSNIRSSNPEKVDPEEGHLKRGVSTPPKTLRIHDPIEAAQSSIRLTLGIKNGHTKQVNEANLQEAFPAKGYHMTKAAMVLQANPAALHRSYNFLETA